MGKSKDINDRNRMEIYTHFRKNPNRSVSIDSLSGMSNASSSTAKAKIEETTEFYRNAAKSSFSQRSSSHTSRTPHATPVHADIPHAYAYAASSSTENIHIHHHRDNGIPSWLMWLLLCRGNGGNNYYYGNATPQQRQENDRNQHRENNFAAWMGAIVIAGIVTLPAIAGAFYLLSELVNNLERLYYNEGYLMAGLGLANIAASLGIGTVLTNTILATAIKAMCVSAGFANPMSWAFFILTAVALLTSACIHYAIQEGIYRTTALYNQNELNPEDPMRFKVTDEQLGDLKRVDRDNKNIKLDNIQNVITAIHHDMTDNPGRSTRWFRYSPFFRSTEVGKQLKEIRNLRTKGTVDYTTTIEIGDGDTDREETLRFNTNSLF